MSSNTIEIMNKGMNCLLEKLGVVDAEQFISIIIRENLIIQNGSKIILMR